MWPPIEIPASTKLRARLITISPIALPPSTYEPWRSRTRAAPRIPKIAPEAPTVTDVGERTSAPAEPARPETR
jgi:hypothetical protein